MGEVVGFRRAEREEEAVPHFCGMARCLACGFRWVAVALIGTVLLTCPGCACDRGVLEVWVSRADAHWHCLCGNCLFLVSEDGSYCPNCGTLQSFDSGGPRAS